MNELALFAGGGGSILAGKLLGWRTRCAVEINAAARRILLARQADGCLEPFPIWDNIETFDGVPWRGAIDVVSGGFPCQDISAAGKGAGIDGKRSGLWSHFARVIGEVQPRFVFVENSPMLTIRGLSRVLGDLATLGYDARWGVVSAADAAFLAGDPAVYHERERIWIVSESTNAQHGRLSQRWGTGVAGQAGGKRSRVHGNEPQGLQLETEAVDKTVDANNGKQSSLKKVSGKSRSKRKRIPESGNSNNARREGYGESPERGRKEISVSCVSDWWKTEPSVGRVVDGLAGRVDRLRAIGNGWVPCVAALAWEILSTSDDQG